MGPGRAIGLRQRGGAALLQICCQYRRQIWRQIRHPAPPPATLVWTSPATTSSGNATDPKGLSVRPHITVLRHNTLRLVALGMLFLGMHNASVYPYQSLIAIERIGLSETVFAGLLVLASFASVTASVLFGMLSDQHGHRRRIAIVTCLASLTGIAMMLLNPSPLTFFLCQGILLPISWSIYGQFFTLARLASPDKGRSSDAVMGVIRAMLSLGFLGTLIFWTLAFAAGATELAVYLTGGVASLIMLTLVTLGWPRDGQTAWEDPKSGLPLRAALRDIAHPHILSRLMLMGALSLPGALFFVLVSLVFDASAVRTSGDVALYIGMLAGWEVPFMLILPRLTQHLRRGTVLAIAAIFYASHLALMPVLSDTWLFWVLPLIAGASGSVILMLPLAYYQDLTPGRPGTASALLAVQKLVVDVLAAAVFAAGFALGGFETVALIGTALGLAGAGGLYLADRARWLAPS